MSRSAERAEGAVAGAGCGRNSGSSSCSSGSDGRGAAGTAEAAGEAVAAARTREGLSQATGEEIVHGHGRAEGGRAGKVEELNEGPDEDGLEEGRNPRVPRAPPRVSREEREAHEITHTPYRSWCHYCVRGRGRNSPHVREKEKDSLEIPRISLDYFFVSSGDEAASDNPILVMLDESTGEKWARAVGQKGLGVDGNMDWLIKDLSEELKSWGHAGGEGGHIILKTDGEPAIIAVREALARYHGGKVVQEGPPRGESQSNGAVEEAGKTVREYARVLKEHVEDKAKIKLSTADVLVNWLIRWSAMICSRYMVGRDGKTPYERRRGRRCNIPAVAFGEKVHYKELRQSKEQKEKFQSEWRHGVWLGHARSSNEHLIGTSEGAIKAYAIKRQGEEQRWDATLLKELQGTPQQPDPSRPGLAVPIRVHFDEPPAAIVGPLAPEKRQIRRMRINAELLKQHGYTPGCEGCRFRRAGLGESRGHSEECRSRIEAAMAQSEAGKRALDEHRLRMNRRRAEQLEEDDAPTVVEPAPQLPRENPERAQNTAAGCSNRGASSGEEPLLAEAAQEPVDQRDQTDDTGDACDQGGGVEDHEHCPSQGGGSDAISGGGGRSRSRSPRRRPDELEISTPERPSAASGDADMVLADSAEVRDAPEGEPEPKRLKPEASDMGAEMDIRGLRKLVTVGPHTKIDCQQPPHEEEEEVAWSAAWDDMTGQELDPDEVRRARAEEMRYVDQRGVWRKVPRSLAARNGWKVIPTRWIDINKGDQRTPNYRSRLVAKEFNTGAQDGLFAATPPLEALRLLVSDAATTSGPKDKVVMLNDVARAFFEAPMKRLVCVELPREACVEDAPGEDNVGLLQLTLYGTRDAAANFQEEVRLFMAREGFTQSRYSPQVYWNQSRGLKTLVHGDDFVTVGARHDIHWLSKRLAQRFEIKTHIVGTGDGEIKEHRILGRIIRATSDGWEYEADPRHAELLVMAMRLEGANGVRSPGEEERPWAAEENAVPLEGAAATEYRALAARANYLAQDRADIQFAAKECCRSMASPTKGSSRALRRLVRYLVAVPRVVWEFSFQPPVSSIDVYSDSDWAGCRRTARSTSGGVIVVGTHCLRSWSVTQKFVTLSSGEAELMALVKASAEAIGLTQLAASWGLVFDANVHVDSSAALAVVHRRGCGKLRHVRIGHLWVQELASEELVSFMKVRGTANPADLMTKHLPGKVLDRLIPLVSQAPREGQAESRLAIHAVIGLFGPKVVRPRSEGE